MSEPLEKKCSNQHSFPNSWIQSPEAEDVNSPPAEWGAFCPFSPYLCLQGGASVLLQLQQWDRSLNLFQIIQKSGKRLPPENARSSKKAHRTKTFVKCELLAAHQNTLRNIVCGLKQIEFYWHWGPRRLRNWFHEISVKLCHWFLFCLLAKNTLLTRKHANPSSHPGSKPQPVLPSASRVSDGRLQFSEFFYLVLNYLSQFFQKKPQTNKIPQNKHKTLKSILWYFIFSTLQSRSVLHRTQIHSVVRSFLYKWSLPIYELQRLFNVKQLLEQHFYASA